MTCLRRPDGQSPRTAVMIRGMEGGKFMRRTPVMLIGFLAWGIFVQPALAFKQAPFLNASYFMREYFEAHPSLRPSDAADVYRLQQRAERGSREAQLALSIVFGTDYNLLVAVKKDKTLALDWLRLASNQGFGDATYFAGLLFASGDHIVAKDPTLALKLFREAAKQGSAWAETTLGYLYETGKLVAKDGAQALNWYLAGARHGNAWAQFHVAQRYETGRGVSRKLEQASKWYSMSAAQGCPPAQVALGDLWASGKLATKDMTRAVRLYKAAANSFDPDGLMRLGECYEYGRGVELSWARALELFDEAASHGSNEASFRLGERFRDGNGVERDYGKAVQYFRYAALASGRLDPRSQYALGRLILAVDLPNEPKGNGYRWIALAAYHGHKAATDDLERIERTLPRQEVGKAQFEIHECLKDDDEDGAPKDMEAAYRWLHLAGENGHLPAQKMLGLMYTQGRELARDLEAAHRWYYLAALQGVGRL